MEHSKFFFFENDEHSKLSGHLFLVVSKQSFPCIETISMSYSYDIMQWLHATGILRQWLYIK
jgi:hypothetical protein